MVTITLDTTDGQTVRVFRRSEPETKSPEGLVKYNPTKVVFEVGSTRYEFLEEDFRSMAQAFVSLDRPVFELTM